MSALLQLVKLTVPQVITLLVPLELALDDIPLLAELAERDSTAEAPTTTASQVGTSPQLTPVTRLPCREFRPAADPG